MQLVTDYPPLMHVSSGSDITRQCSNAEVVKCPCWSADGSRRLLMLGGNSASIIFADGQGSEISAMRGGLACFREWDNKRSHPNQLNQT